MSDVVQDLETKLANTTDPLARIDLLCELAWELRDTNPHRSYELFEQAYQLSNSAPSGEPVYRHGLIKSLRGLAYSNRRVGNLALALSQSTQALTYLESVALPGVEVDTLRNIAIILGSLGNYSEGLEYAFKALNLAQSIGDREREATILISIGVIYVNSKNIEDSLRTFERALQLSRESGQKREEALTLNNQSLAYRVHGDYDKALASSLQALQLAGEAKFPALIITATGTVGEAYLALNEYEQAGLYLQKYLAAARSAGSKRDEAWALILLGETDHRQGQESSAFAYLFQALLIVKQIDLRSEEARCHELLSDIYEQQGDLKESLAQLKLFYQIKESIFNENTAKRIANLQLMHQVETAQRDTEIQYLKTVELQREIEERKKTESALQELADIDPLTEILNRRKFFALAEIEIQSALQGSQPVSAIVLDVDEFKVINDNYGHAIGDQVLIVISQTMRDNLRKEEIVGRIGGDEFAILLPGSNRLQGQSIAQRLQKKIVSQSLKINQAEICLTISVGIAELDRERDHNFSMLLDHADQAMYASKRSGRNRITTYDAD